MASGKRVLAAMSGGVDSSVAALLLKQKGYEVIGITLQLLEREEGEQSCCSLESAELARKAAARIGIAHYVLNFRGVFKREVIDKFCSEYLSGRTPNPCIECNSKIKFGALLRKADELGAGFIATGHYARIERGRGKTVLKKGIDPRKDQSYFLYTMTPAQLSRTLMPLGTSTKQEVRRIARKERLPNSDKPESQEICFIRDGDYRRFLAEKMPGKIRAGKIVDRDRNILGEHSGTVYFTIGQRRGLGVKGGKPRYVIGIQGSNVVVGERQQAYSRSCVAEEINLTGEKVPEEAEVKIRHPGTPCPAGLRPEPGGDRIKIKFKEPQWAVAPGQAAVFYSGETVIGGGKIAPRNGENGYSGD